MTINHMPDANAKAKELSEGEANDALLKVTRDSTSSKECSRSILELPPVVLEEIVALVLEDLSGRDRLNALFRVSYTSKYIYAIMHGASRLWAFVDSELAANVNEQLIRKSGSAPLTIICRSDMKREFDEWGVIERERSRWKQLKIVDRTLGHCSGWDSDYIEALSRLQLGLTQFCLLTWKTLGCPLSSSGFFPTN
ncbi:hypothetical protein FRC02_010808 [Tulasnella sp. 418]|nr:hypothetical protein FRC02_010808 [Tulasnella sp. 418]